MIELTPRLELDATEPIYMQLYRYIREEIAEGHIPARARLPSVRRLADHLGVSRTPVALAYEQLTAEGYVHSRPRSGLYVADIAGEQLGLPFPPRPGEREGRVQSPSPRPLPHNKQAAASLPAYADLPRAYHEADSDSSGAIRYDFGYGRVDLASFPLVKWRRYMNRVLVPENGRVLLYGDLQGERGLREEIASYLHQIRGVRCLPEQIVVGAGTYHSLDLLLQLLAGQVREIAAEEAVNDGVKALFRQHRYDVVPLSLEPDGLSVEELAATAAEAVYTTPSHQFPYGMTLSAAKRAKLLQWAADTGAWIIENDYDGEFRYAGRPIPSLQGLDENGRVIYLGTFSRALSPAFRLSYLVLPAELLHRFRERRHSYDQLASPILQHTLQLFMASGDFGRHMRRMRGLYRRKHDTAVQAVAANFGRQVEVIGAGSGLHIVLRPGAGDRSESQLVEAAQARGIRVYPVSPYGLRQRSNGSGPHGYGIADSSAAAVILGFGGMSEPELEQGIAELAAAWERS